MKDRTQPPIPENIQDYVDADRMAVIEKFEQYGWDLWFVRRPLFQDSIVVLKHQQTGATCIIDENAHVRHEHDLAIRP